MARRYGAEKTHDALHKILKGAPPESMVRHLVSGDVASNGDDYVEAANHLHAARQDLMGFGYTHNWRNMSSSDARGWVLNASTETASQAADAINKGWQAVIESPEDQDLSGQKIAGRRVVTCPNQSTGGAVGCADCKLCAKSHPGRPIIQFLAHGNKEAQVSARLAKAREEETEPAQGNGVRNHEFILGTN